MWCTYPRHHRPPPAHTHPMDRNACENFTFLQLRLRAVIIETSSYPGWIKSPHVVTLSILKPSEGGVFRSKLWSSQIWSFLKWGGYSGVNFGHPKSEVFRNGGGYSRVTFGHPKSEVFRNGGGVFQSKLWSSQIWSFPKWGGYSGVNFGHPKSEVFRNGGGGFLVWDSRKGLSGKFGPKFTVQPETCLCITVVSHILRMWRLTKPFVLQT